MGGWVEMNGDGGMEGGVHAWIGGWVGETEETVSATRRCPQNMGQRELGPKEGQVLKSRQKAEAGGWGH